MGGRVAVVAWSGGPSVFLFRRVSVSVQGRSVSRVGGLVRPVRVLLPPCRSSAPCFGSVCGPCPAVSGFVGVGSQVARLIREVVVGGTHVEFASGIPGTTCPGCERDTVRVVVLVNRHGLVLAHGSSCVQCGLERHRARRHGDGFVADSDMAAAAA